MDSYGNPSSPAPMDLGLPAPWIAQFDEASQTPYFVNTQTGESKWTHPVDGSVFHPPAGGADYQQPYDQQQQSSTRDGGAAASFYGGAGSTSVDSTYSNNPSSSYTAQPGDGERGLGSKLAIGGLAFMAYKMYKSHEKKNKYKYQNQGMYGGSGYGYAPQQMMFGGGGPGGMLGSFLGGGGKREMGGTDTYGTSPSPGPSTPGYEQPTGHQAGWMPPAPPAGTGWQAPPPPSDWNSFSSNPAPSYDNNQSMYNSGPAQSDYNTNQGGYQNVSGHRTV